jgi:MoxR-like ATPase
MLDIPHRGISPDMLGDLRPLVAESRFLRLQETVDATVVPEQVARFLVSVVRKTRELDGVVLGASPRASIHLLAASKVKARLSGRDHVTIEDIVAMAPHVLGHRIIIEGASSQEVVREAVHMVLPGVVPAA